MVTFEHDFKEVRVIAIQDTEEIAFQAKGTASAVVL